MKYRSSRGTTIDIPDGLTAKQIASIKADADAGYGTRAQQTANSLTSKAAAPTPAAPVAAAPAPKAEVARDPAKVTQYQEAVKRIKTLQPGTPEYQKNAETIRTIGTEYGYGWQDKANFTVANAPVVGSTIDTPVGDTVATDGPKTPPRIDEVFKTDTTLDLPKTKEVLEDGRAKDAEDQFKADNPDEVDQYGNTVTYTMGPDGKRVRKVIQGDTAKTFTDLALAAARGFDPKADQQAAYDDTYGSLTKYYDRDMARALEAQKQELANRGIPYDPAAAQDPNTHNLYGRSIGAIDQKYHSYKDDAARQATSVSNDVYKTRSDVQNAFLNTAMKGSGLYGPDFTNYVNTTQSKFGEDTKWMISMSADQIATLRGITVAQAQAEKDNALKNKQLEEQKRSNKASEGIARASIKPSGGGGGRASTGSSSDGGFQIPD